MLSPLGGLRPSPELRRGSQLAAREPRDLGPRVARAGPDRARAEAAEQTVRRADRRSAGVPGRVHHVGGDPARQEEGDGPGAAAEGAGLQEGAGES